MSETTVPRPKLNDPDVVRRHMAAIRDHVAKHLELDDVDEIDDAMQDVERAMEYQSDGYHIAESLESHGWTADAELVSVMHDLAHERRSALREAEAEWVKDNGIKASVAIGDQVIIVNRHSQQNGLRGEVVGIDDVRVKCTVMVPERGHVRTGCGTHGFILDVEDVARVSVEKAG